MPSESSWREGFFRFNNEDTMALQDGVKQNFNTLSRAFNEDSVALLECTDNKTGETIPVVCAVHMEGEEYVLTPIAKMFTGNPYEEVSPPSDMKDESQDATPIRNI
jgi:uncharacterized protein DUF6117